MKDQSIEQIFRERLNDVESDVPAETWKAIENRLDVLMPAAGTATSAMTGLAGKWLVGGALLSAITAAIYFFPSGNEIQKETMPDVTQPAEVVTQSAERIKALPEQLSSGQNQTTTGASQKALTAEINNDKEVVSFETFTARDQINPLEQQSDPIADDKPERDKNRVEAISQVQEEAISGEVIVEEKQEKHTAEWPLVEESFSEAFSVASMPVPEIKYHDVITPNLDNINDIFRVEANEAVESFTVTIRNLSGKVIHQWSAPYGFWDGRLEDGRPAPAGKYLVDIFVQPVNGKPFHKPVTIQLIR